MILRKLEYFECEYIRNIKGRYDEMECQKIRSAICQKQGTSLNVFWSFWI
jgi:hypothetical protein